MAVMCILHFTTLYRATYCHPILLFNGFTFMTVSLYTRILKNGQISALKMVKGDDNVRVCVRIRPLFGKEKQEGRKVVVVADRSDNTISANDPESGEVKAFTFDEVFPPQCTQQEVYTGSAHDIVEAVLNGFNGTIFAYGQTGAGKSHTMEGYNDPPELRGIIPTSFQHIFEKVNGSADTKQYLVRASYLEIYNEQVRDLLSRTPTAPLDLKENSDTGIYVKDLTAATVKDASEMDHVMQMGKKNRSVGSTLMNATSSRSHSMFQIIVECLEKGSDGKEHVCVGKLNLVDLAGSERQSKTGATGDRLKEAVQINLSLSALGNVIKALVAGKMGHIPYRDSKLTRLLQDSLGGNAKTVMIANVGPADFNLIETISTLRYADRAKKIKNKPKINEDPKDTMLRQCREEIETIKAQLFAQGKDSSNVSYTSRDGKQVREKVVEKIVIQREGLSKDELAQFEADATREAEGMETQMAADMKAMRVESSKTEEERFALEKQWRSKAEAKDGHERDREQKLEKLAKLQAKLIMGGKIMDKAAMQEAELRETRLKLEEGQRQDMLMARELAEQDESTLELEGQHASLSEEVEVKTKKLKKLWAKHKELMAELNDKKDEFRVDREEMLETIRALKKQLALKVLIRKNFIPPEEWERIKKRAVWDQNKNTYVLSTKNVAPMVLKRPVSLPGLRRPETEYARHRKQFDKFDPNISRYKMENIITLEFDSIERTTEVIAPFFST